MRKNILHLNKPIYLVMLVWNQIEGKRKIEKSIEQFSELNFKLLS